MQMNTFHFNLIQPQVKFIICVQSFNVIIAIPLTLKALFFFILLLRESLDGK